MATYYSQQPNPQYKFKYQVADEQEQTYISHNEDRDGAAVTGQYQYVDPLGSLIIVRYTADDNGYSETREVQNNFLTIRAKPKKEVVAVQPRPAPRPAPRPVAAQTGDANLVASIIATLTPFIKQTVSTSLGARSTTGLTGSRRVVEVQQPVRRVVQVQQPVVTETRVTGTSSIFGEDGVNRIQVETPVFNFDEFLS